MNTFYYPINPKYLPALKVTGRWPQAEVQCDGPHVIGIMIDPLTLSNLTKQSWLVAEIEQAAINNATVPDTGVEEAREDWKLFNNW